MSRLTCLFFFIADIPHGWYVCNVVFSLCHRCGPCTVLVGGVFRAGIFRDGGFLLVTVTVLVDVPVFNKVGIFPRVSECHMAFFVCLSIEMPVQTGGFLMAVQRLGAVFVFVSMSRTCLFS